MKLNSFLQVINYFKKASANREFFLKYRKLADILKEATDNPKIDYTERIFLANEDLCCLLLETDPSGLGIETYRLFEKIDTYRLFGKPASDSMQDLLASKEKKYQEVYYELDKKIKALNRMSDSISQFNEIFDLELLSGLLDPEKSDHKNPGLYLFFEGSLAVKSIRDLERYTRIWDGIIQSFAELTGHDKQLLDFCNFQDETVMLVVTTENITLEAIMRGTIGILSSLGMVMKIRKIQSDISPLPLLYNYVEMLDEEIDVVVNQAAFKVAGELVNHYRQTDAPDNEDILRNLCRSVKQILNFVEKGGKLECKPSRGVKEGEELKKRLLESFLSVQKLKATTGTLPERTYYAEQRLVETY